MLGTNECEHGVPNSEPCKECDSITSSSVQEIIVARIIYDLCGRSGGDDWFELLDKDIQAEIIETCVGIVSEYMEG